MEREAKLSAFVQRKSHWSLGEKPEQRVQRKDDHKARMRETFTIDLPKVNVESAIETMRLAREHGLTTEAVTIGSSPQSATEPRAAAPLTQDEKLAARMKAAFESARQRTDMRSTLAHRQRLPLMAKENQKALLKLVNDNDVAVILAKTGSGKTTQVPQILLDDMILSGNGPVASVLCTQPRRIAATSVAQRVAEERHDAIQNTVGYHIRNENSSPKHRGSITYCTTGILMNRLVSCFLHSKPHR